MKKWITVAILVAVAGLFVSISKAQEPNAPKMNPNVFRGRVVVVKDANNVITSVKLENRRRGNFNIVLDEKGKELGQKMDGKFVEVIAKETIKNDEKWLTVESYKEVERPMPRHRPGEPNAPEGHGGEQ